MQNNLGTMEHWNIAAMKYTLSSINTQPFSGLPRVKKPVESGFF
jgi:hypothetical protein